MNKKEAYQEILAVLEKHGELLEEDYILDERSTIRNRIKGEGISAMFGIELRGYNGGDWHRMSEHQCITYFSADNPQKTISCSDNRKQPSSEWLYQISFPTGPYSLIEGGGFNKPYPQETFRDFFEELKSYGPKFIDTRNNSLFFSPDNAEAVHEAFEDIFKKYKDIVGEELRSLRVKELEAELQKLK